ncbi:MAG TPA: IS4 family transposase [Clostridia bacterium]|nr:IS4 family transposase [Clostridia bacterium]
MFTTAELFGKFHSPKKSLRHTLDRVGKAPPSELEQLFKDCLPAGLLSQADSGLNSRERVYSVRVTFWSFMWQALNHAPCRSAVRKVMAWFSLHGLPAVKEDTSPYCKGRGRLDRDTLKQGLEGSARAADQRAPLKWRFHDREVLVADGTTSAAPDTRKNQRAFPQSALQKPGCGFPMVRWVGLFSLATGALVDVAIGNKHKAELTLLRRIWDRLKKGMIFLADRGFCDYVTLAGLFLRGVDSVLRLNGSRDYDFRKGKRLGAGDRLVVWQKPSRRTRTATKKLWRRLPDQITLRLICWPVTIPGFRTRKVVLVTTLLDPVAYPAAELAGLYLRRWRVELFLRDIKTTLGIDTLTCKTPKMLYRELMMHLIAYNMIRCLMVEAASISGVNLEKISFKGAVDTLHHFSLALAIARSHKQRIELVVEMLRAMAQDRLPTRPNRIEPRCCKRRRKAYPVMVKPRSELKAKILLGKKRKSKGA